jgi:hypothetical protein
MQVRLSVLSLRTCTLMLSLLLLLLLLTLMLAVQLSHLSTFAATKLLSASFP